MKNIFVLGGTGFVGTHLCEKLVREGWNVTVPTRRRATARHVQPLPLVTVLELDVHDEVALTRAMAGHDAVVNLVAILHGTPAAFNAAHVALPQKIARACIATGVKQLVHVSALGANARHADAAPSHYLRTKGQGEAALVLAAMGQGANAGHFLFASAMRSSASASNAFASSAGNPRLANTLLSADVTSSRNRPKPLPGGTWRSSADESQRHGESCISQR